MFQHGFEPGVKVLGLLTANVVHDDKVKKSQAHNGGEHNIIHVAISVPQFTLEHFWVASIAPTFPLSEDHLPRWGKNALTFQNLQNNA